MKLVIIGAGFGGLQLARKLRNKAGFDIIPLSIKLITINFSLYFIK